MDKTMNEIDKWEIENIEKLYKSIIMKEPPSISIFSFFHQVIKLRRVKQAHSIYPDQIKDPTFPSKIKLEFMRPCDQKNLKIVINSPSDKKRAPEVIAQNDECEKWNDCYGKYTFVNDNNLRGYYIGDFKNGEFDGRGTLMFIDGYVYQGEFKNGLKNGFGAAFVKDEEKYKKYIGIWKNDELVSEK